MIKPPSRQRSEFLWRPRVVLRKWLNISAKDADFSADSSTDNDDDNDDDCDSFFDHPEVTPRLRRRNSETLRAQYIDKKEIRVCVGTWNVGGKTPPDDLEIDEWIESSEPADVYVLGLQEVVPLNAGNIFGAEDSRPVLKWEGIIREALNRITPERKYKSFSDPPSPSKFKPTDDSLDMEDELLLELDSECEEEVHPVDGFPCSYEVRDKTVSSDDFTEEDEKKFVRQFSSPKKLDRLQCFQSGIREDEEEEDKFVRQTSMRLSKTISGNERSGLSWLAPPSNLLAQHVFERTCSFGLKSTKSFKTTKSFRTFSSFKSVVNEDYRTLSDISLLSEIDLERLIYRRRKPEYVRIVSKQMVGVFLTIWVRRRLRKHINNLKVSTVGVGVMGYIGNKGSVSVSMSIHQTLFCFICTHLTSGEKEGDELKRNADVYEIHRRTQFYPSDGLGFPRNIHDHERIIWLGDLNYRINLPYEETRALISKKEWSKLLDKDQLHQELKDGCVFEGWYEGRLTFPPTYKYEQNSQKYVGEDPKAAGRRNPAWCDRVLAYGNAMELLSYKRAELMLSDHRPVTATYVVEVEDLCPRKLQRALTFTDAEIDSHEMLVVDHREQILYSLNSDTTGRELMN
ncbi:hypothetical protein V2J09_014083 [Rumex salicifolius]